MLTVDFHAHSFFSGCGMHTHIELLTRAKELGMKGLAITDHGPALNTRFPSPFFDRLKDPVVPGIRFIKGMECNIIDKNGSIDLKPQHRKYMEIVLVGLHPAILATSGKEENTQLVVKALENNPCIDIVVHPDDLEFPVDFDIIAHAAKKHGTALELNNSKTLYKRTTPEQTKALILACKNAECFMSIDSDTHVIHELGLDSSVRPYLAELDFPEGLIINRTAESAFEFVQKRLPNKV